MQILQLQVNLEIFYQILLLLEPTESKSQVSCCLHMILRLLLGCTVGTAIKLKMPLLRQVQELYTDIYQQRKMQPLEFLQMDVLSSLLMEQHLPEIYGKLKFVWFRNILKTLESLLIFMQEMRKQMEVTLEQSDVSEQISDLSIKKLS